MLAYWLYRSRALTQPYSREDSSIWLQSRERNPARGITGHLHRDELFYVQYIEGPIGPFSDICQQIACDDRHCDIDTLLCGMTPVRRFSSWNMEFTDDALISFNTFQKLRGEVKSLSKSAGPDILQFMDAVSRSDLINHAIRERSLSDRSGSRSFVQSQPSIVP